MPGTAAPTDGQHQLQNMVTQGRRVALGGPHDTVIKKVCAAIEQAGQLSRQGSKGLHTEQYEGSPQCSIEVGNN